MGRKKIMRGLAYRSILAAMLPCMVIQGCAKTSDSTETAEKGSISGYDTDETGTVEDQDTRREVIKRAFIDKYTQAVADVASISSQEGFEEWLSALLPENKVLNASVTATAGIKAEDHEDSSITFDGSIVLGSTAYRNEQCTTECVCRMAVTSSQDNGENAYTKTAGLYVEHNDLDGHNYNKIYASLGNGWASMAEEHEDADMDYHFRTVKNSKPDIFSAASTEKLEEYLENSLTDIYTVDWEGKECYELAGTFDLDGSLLLEAVDVFSEKYFEPFGVSDWGESLKSMLKDYGGFIDCDVKIYVDRDTYDFVYADLDLSGTDASQFIYAINGLEAGEYLTQYVGAQTGVEFTTETAHGSIWFSDESVSVPDDVKADCTEYESVVESAAEAESSQMSEYEAKLAWMESHVSTLCTYYTDENGSVRSRYVCSAVVPDGFVKSTEYDRCSNGTVPDDWDKQEDRLDVVQESTGEVISYRVGFPEEYMGQITEENLAASFLITARDYEAPLDVYKTEDTDGNTEYCCVGVCPVDNDVKFTIIFSEEMMKQTIGLDGNATAIGKEQIYQFLTELVYYDYYGQQYELVDGE